jgi:hypothetical protein
MIIGMVFTGSLGRRVILADGEYFAFFNYFYDDKIVFNNNERDWNLPKYQLPVQDIPFPQTTPEQRTEDYRTTCAAFYLSRKSY